MDREGHAHELRQNSGPSGPGFNDLSVLGVGCDLNFLHQVVIDEWTFF
jgi:hypothetical protein